MFKNIKTPDDLLQEYKEKKAAQVNSLRDSKLDTFIYEDVEYQTRPTDRENILGQAMKIALGDTSDISWIASDNTVKTFTAPEFIAFANAVGEDKRVGIFKGRMMKDAILTATSKEAVDSIEWPV